MMRVADLLGRMWTPALPLAAALVLSACEAPQPGSPRSGPANTPAAGSAPLTSGNGVNARAASDTGAFEFKLPANVPPEMRPLVTWAANRAAAKVLAFDCPTVQFRSGLDSRMQNGIFQELSRARVRQVDVDRTFSRILQTELDPQVEAYAFSRGLVEGKPETFCAAAQSEIASGSGIGQLLGPV